MICIPRRVGCRLGDVPSVVTREDHQIQSPLLGALDQCGCSKFEQRKRKANQEMAGKGALFDGSI